MKSILIPFFLFLMIIKPVYAEESTRGFCQNAETTVDLVQCIGERYKAEVAYMDDLYQTLITDKDESMSDFRATLKSNQDDWIEYRDKKCEFEGSVYEGGSLERVQTIACLARTTKERADHLNALMTDDNNVPVFASPPRWKNVLMQDYPNIYWAIGKTTSLDSDCDTTEEQIVKGIEIGSETGKIKTILAIVDSPVTGRATVTILKPEWDEACLQESVNFVKKPDQEGCFQTYTSTNKACDGYVLNYNESDQKYTFSLPAGDIQEQPEKEIINE